MNTPVAFFIFNRPGTTQQVFDAIRQAKPAQLLVVADGPRQNRPGEAERCAAAREILNQIDWPCELLTHFSDVNLGCKGRVSSGLDWVFETVEEAIILEDDCLPDPSFFRYCAELLEKFRHDQRVFSITGQNVQLGRSRGEHSYYFSRYTHCWGWASWRRAWQHYDVDMKAWPQFRDQGLLKDVLSDPYAVKVWTKVFQMMYDRQIDTWDYQWQFACWLQNGLNIMPNLKVIENLGFGVDGTHTQGKENPYQHIPLQSFSFPLKHPPFMVRHGEADYFTQRTLYDYEPPLLKRAIRKVKKLTHFAASL